jgi:predicted Zn-dependent protease
VLAGILAATVGVFLFLVFSGDTLADMAVAMTPTEQDRMVTEKHVEFQQALKESLSADHPLSRKVSAIGTKLVQAIPGGTPYTYRFHVVPNRAINAYAFPGGEIFINLGMISLMTSDEQLAAVLAHEIQHVEQRHFRHGFYRGISRSILFSMALGIFGDNTADALAEFSILGHGRAQESQADLLGLKLLYGAGLPRAGMVDMLNLLAEQGGNGLTWLSTHPDSRDRATAVARQPLP